MRKFNIEPSKREYLRQQDAKVIDAYNTQTLFDEFSDWIPISSHDEEKIEEGLSSNSGEDYPHTPDIQTIQFPQPQLAEEKNQNNNNNNPIELTVRSYRTSESPIQLPRRGYRESFNDAEFKIKNPVQGNILSYLVKSLDSIVNEPFLYFAKRPDPVSIHMAIEYIVNNEMSDNIFVVHFVDDRKISKDLWKSAQETVPSNDQQKVKEKYTEILMENMMSGTLDSYEMGTVRCLRHTLPIDAQELVDYVSIMDTFYT